MKTSLMVVAALALMLGVARGQAPAQKPLTPEQKARLEESTLLKGRAYLLRDTGLVAPAIAAAEKALAIERSLLDPLDPEIIASLLLLEGLHLAREDFAAARKASQEVVAIYTQWCGAGTWQVTDARLRLERVDLLARLTREQRQSLAEADTLSRRAVALHGKGQNVEAARLTGQALEIRRQLQGEKHPDYARTLATLAELYRLQGDHARAEPLLHKVLEIRKQVLGEKHPHYASSLNGLALVYWGQGDYSRAEPLYRRALEIARQTTGEKEALTAEILINLAALYQARAQYAPAERLLRYALEVTRETLGEDSRLHGTSLNNLAALFSATGDYARAEALFRQALEIKKQVLGERHPDYATSLNNLASLYRMQGDHVRAEPLQQQALEIIWQTLGEKHPSYAAHLGSLASAYQQRGDYARAEPLQQKALEITRQSLGEKHPAHATRLHNLAALYRETGDYARAEPLYREALAVKKQALGAKHLSCAATLVELAALYATQGNYVRAEASYREALAIQQQALGEKHPDGAATLTGLATLYYVRGDHARAEPLREKAFEIIREALGEKHPRHADGLLELAFLHQQRGEYARAELLSRPALQIQEQALLGKHPGHAAALSQLASLHQAKGDHAQAEALYRRSADIWRQAFGEKSPGHALGLQRLAVLHTCQQDYARAEPLLRQALTCLGAKAGTELPPLNRLGPSDLRPHPLTADVLNWHGFVLHEQARPKPSAAQLRAAEQSFALAAGVVERIRHEALPQPENRLQLGERYFSLPVSRVDVRQQLYELEGKVSDLEAALGIAEQGSARVFLQSLGEARGRVLGGVPAELLDGEAQFLRQLRLLDLRIAKEHESSPRPDADLIDRLYEERKGVETRLQELVRRMEREHPRYAALKYPRPCSLAEARGCLAANETALLYQLGQDAAHVVLVQARPAADDPAQGLAIFRLPGADALAELVAPLTDPDTLGHTASVRALGAKAYRAILAPLHKQIEGKDLVIVPGGSLSYLPFELLVDNKGKYLVETHHIRYAPSLTVLHLTRQWEKTRAKPERALWAMADPVYEKDDARLHGQQDLSAASQAALAEYLSRVRGGLKYDRLQYSGREVRAIARLFETDDMLTDLLASEAAVKAASEKGILSRCRYVHFATHGILGLGTGRQPALVLSLVGNEKEDGFLTLEEVTNLKLNADLVVLSACRSGQGRLYNGEGVRGLARAFLYAGSRGVLCSLWAVDDQETADLMVDVYRGLKAGKSSPDALREAQLKMLKAGKPPFYWAPFILIGE